MAVKAKDTVEMTICIDKDITEKAEELFKRLGIDMNTAFNIFLCVVVNEGGISFPSV